jgi:hypothetical protein
VAQPRIVINNGAYFFRITGVAVNEQKVPTPPGAFDSTSTLDAAREAPSSAPSHVTPRCARTSTARSTTRSTQPRAASRARRPWRRSTCATRRPRSASRGSGAQLRRGHNRPHAGGRPELDDVWRQLAGAGERPYRLLHDRRDGSFHAGGGQLGEAVGGRGPRHTHSDGRSAGSRSKQEQGEVGIRRAAPSPWMWSVVLRPPPRELWSRE